MKREPFQTLTSKTVVLPQANIDTDQIIPARFLKSISREGGFRAVVSLSIADIFRSNAVKNGLLPVVVDQATHAFLLEHSGAEVTIDLRAQTLSYDGGRKSASFPLDPFSRHCLLEGVDELGFLLSHEEAIAAFERAHAAEQA
jgi:3-isopropylmalate/(R)-2-methylmalate dehydratase small subunit